jgi:C4-dicarboxylate transporter/malic acid transport protein
MATGGIALLLSPQNQPHIFTGLETIGKMVYIWDLVVFTCVLSAITYRFVQWPYTLRTSLTHPTESLFFAASFLSLASIIAGMAQYAIPSCGYWLVVVYRVLFWMYFAATFVVAVGMYCLLFTNPRLKIQDMTPAWDLPIFPFMLCGTIASSGLEYQPKEYAMPMLFGGLTAQGLGMMVSMCMYASYVRRMINYGFPSPESRPGMFIAVGPPSFTSLAIIGLADKWPRGYDYFGPDEVTEQVVRVIALLAAVFIWSLSLWFFAIAVVSCLAVYKTFRFRLNWWAFVFPNVGFALATINIGRSLHSQGVMWVGSVMTLGLVLLYLFVLFHHARALLRRDLLYFGKDEDHAYKQERQGKIEARATGGDLEKCPNGMHKQH